MKFKTQLKRHWLLILVLIAFLGWVLYSYLTEGVFYLLATSNLDSIVSYIQSFGFFAAIIFVFLVLLEVVLAPIPPFILYIAGGLLFGAFWGGTLTLVGNVLGAVIAFLIARKFGRELVENKVDPLFRRKFDRFSEKYGAFSLFILRLNPFTTSDIFSYIAGLTTMRLRTLVLSTTFGLIPLIYVQTYLGDVFVRENPVLFFVFVAISIIYVIFFLYGLWYLVLKKKKAKKLPLKK